MGNWAHIGWAIGRVPIAIVPVPAQINELYVGISLSQVERVRSVLGGVPRMGTDGASEPMLHYLRAAVVGKLCYQRGPLIVRIVSCLSYKIGYTRTVK